MAEEQLIEERKQRIVNFFKKSNWVFVGILVLILILNVYIRTLPMKNLEGTDHPGLWDVTTNNWTLGPDLDPFLFLRYAKEIVATGGIMKIDMMRYVPLGFETARETRLLPYMIAYLYKFMSLFSNISVDYAGVIFPVVASVLTTIFFFLLVRKIFEKNGKIANIIASVTTAFLVVLPSLLSRTIAGIPEKESIGFGLMFAAFYFFLSAWRAKKIKNAVILGLLAGVFTSLMGLIWGGVIFIFMGIAITVFIAFILNKVGKKEVLVYFTWFVSYLVFLLPLTNRFSLKSLITSTSSGLTFGLFFILVIDLIIFKTKIKDYRLVEKIRKKLPDRFISIIAALILIIALTSIFFGIGFIYNFFSDTLTELTTPYANRLLYTVAENKQPYFGEWKESFGPSRIAGIGGSLVSIPPLFFWLFFVGSIFLFYEMSRFIKKRERIILTLSYVIFLFALIFSRYSSGGLLDGTNTLSKILYFGGMILFGASFVYVYYKYYKNKELELFKKIDFNYLFIFVLFFINIVAARSAIRLIMALAPVGAIIMGYFCVSTVNKALKSRGELMKILAWLLAILIVISTLYTFYVYYETSKAMAASNIPSAYNIQWQKAMQWVREETPKDAVFGHWWDYGYWLQSNGERATMLDGGNAVSYWNYLMGRHVLTSPNESDALDLLYTHNVTYFLIDSTEIGKYGAYSSIGSDENFDRMSWISTFILNDAATQETRNETSYFYGGGGNFGSTALDEDYIYKDSQTGREILLPGSRAGVGAMILGMIDENGGKQVSQPKGIFVYNGEQFEIPLRYLFYEGEIYDFKKGYEGCLYVFPRLDVAGESFSLNPTGASMFLSERNMRALWVRLYLFGEGDYFKLVHTEQNSIVSMLKSQSNLVGDFVYFQGIQGPIKIWEIEYTGNEKINPEYQMTDFPERIIQRKYQT